MRRILYSDFESKEEMLRWFNSSFACLQYTGIGFIRAENAESYKKISEVFFSYMKKNDIRIFEGDYFFNRNIDIFAKNCCFWEKLSGSLKKTGKENDALRKNAVFILENSTDYGYMLNLKEVKRKYIISEMAGKIIVTGSVDFLELIEIWRDYGNVIDEILFFPFESGNEKNRIPDLRKFYSISFNTERIGKYNEYIAENQAEFLEKLGKMLEVK